jgi:GNAT superfamily N-acetyltransferase
MYEDWGAGESRYFGQADLEAMGEDYSAYLQVHLPDGIAHAWIAQLDEEVVASGAISILAYPPGPGALGKHTALLHSMYTVPEYRSRDVARRVLETAIAFCRANGCKRVVLGGKGTEAGRHLYESVEFKPTEVSQLIL